MTSLQNKVCLQFLFDLFRRKPSFKAIDAMYVYGLEMHQMSN